MRVRRHADGRVRLLAPRDRSEQKGLTLIELLVTVVILGLAFVVILGGLSTAILGSDIQHRQVNADATLRSAADQVRSAPYEECAPPLAYDSVVTDPAGFAVTATVIGYLNVGDERFVSDCPVDPALNPDQGVQLIRIVATANARTVKETFEVVKRR